VPEPSYWRNHAECMRKTKWSIVAHKGSQRRAAHLAFTEGPAWCRVAMCTFITEMLYLFMYEL